MKKQLQLFWVALMFYTRIPVPKDIDHSAGALNQATVYFPVIGWIVGALSGGVYIGLSYIFPSNIAVLGYMLTSILITGAFHEDGFADVCDGFGGGWTKEKILTIMKDSAIGAYGALGIGLLLLLKFQAIWDMTYTASADQLLFLMISAHSLSRGTALTLIYTDTYVREDQQSKAKPIAQGLSTLRFSIALLLALAPLLILHQSIIYLCLIIPLVLTRQYMSYYFKKWIGGYTGDCLGAVQQVSEVIIYLSAIVLWKFT